MLSLVIQVSGEMTLFSRWITGGRNANCVVHHVLVFFFFLILVLFTFLLNCLYLNLHVLTLLPLTQFAPIPLGGVSEWLCGAELLPG